MTFQADEMLYGNFNIWFDLENHVQTIFPQLFKAKTTIFLLYKR